MTNAPTHKAYQAYGTAGRFTADTPRAAALGYFGAHPETRKCNVTEGAVDGGFFVVTYGRRSDGQWPSSWKDITRKTASTLPENA